MVAYSYQNIGYAGTDITYTAPTGGVLGDSVPSPDFKGFLWVKNAAAGGTITVTMNVPGSVFGINTPDVPINIADGEERLIGPLVAELGDPAFFGGVILSITPNVTGVTAAAVRLP